MDDKELLHYGVPGMKWGHRKSPDEIKRQRRDSKADNDEDEAHDDYKKTIASKSMKSMSTREIQEINTRIQAENQFRELNKTGFDRFKDRVKSIAANIAEEQAKKFVNHYVDAGREKVQGLIDEKTGLGRLLGIDTKSEQNRKAFEFKLKTTREQWEKAFGKKKQLKKDEETDKKSSAVIIDPSKQDTVTVKPVRNDANNSSSFVIDPRDNQKTSAPSISGGSKISGDVTSSKKTATAKMIAIAKKKKKK